MRRPEPGEWWRIHIRPVEWTCPNCHSPLHVGGIANNGTMVRILPPQDSGFRHVRRGCNAFIPLPEGWVWYSTVRSDGDSTAYTLPWTLFDPIDNPERAPRYIRFTSEEAAIVQ